MPPPSNALSGWLAMPFEPMGEVAGRPILGALELLLGVDWLFGGNQEQRLLTLLSAGRKNQNEVSTRLSEQVLEALWGLLLGFDEAERLAQLSGRSTPEDQLVAQKRRNELVTQAPRIREIAAAHGASNLAAFGSVARDQAGPDSDLDLLIDLPPNTGLLERIDLIRRRNLKPTVREPETGMGHQRP
jgi:uncharacterized protein